MRIPSFVPKFPPRRPSLAQMRIRLCNVIRDGDGHLPTGNGMTLRTAMEAQIAKREVEEEYRAARAPLVAHLWGRLEPITTESQK